MSDGLWDFPSDLTPFERYQEWRATAESQRVYDWILGAALERRREGRSYYSHRTLWELARDHFRGLEGDGRYALNDHWLPFMARELMERHPDLAGFFHVRERAA